LGYKNANSTEFDLETNHPVIDLMQEQKKIKNKGGTMRLGSYKCSLEKGTQIYNSYKSTDIHERHRHRYEFNNNYKSEFNDHGMKTPGINSKLNLVETIELDDHPWLLGHNITQNIEAECLNPILYLLAL